MDEPFTASTLSSSWVAPVAPPLEGPNTACLSASTSEAPNPELPGCSSIAIDPDGSGVLRLTDTGQSQVGSAYFATSVPTAGGLEFSFDTFQYGGGGADNITFRLAATDPAVPAAPTENGPYLGMPGTSGVPFGYLGFAVDAWGSFSAQGAGTSCPTSPSAGNSLAVRGPGNGENGYCLVTNQTVSPNSVRGSTPVRPAPVPVHVIINPSNSEMTGASGLVAPAYSWAMRATPLGTSTPVDIDGPLPNAMDLSGLDFPADWYNPTTGVPYQLSFGFGGFNGDITDNHEVSNLQVNTLSSQVGVYSLSSQAPGTWTTGVARTVSVTPSLASGQGDDQTGAIVTTTFPDGLTPGTATGTNYTCTTSGQVVTCTWDGMMTPITAGSTLPAIEIPATAANTGTFTVSSIVSSRTSSPATSQVQITTGAAASITADPASVVRESTTTLTMNGLPGEATGTITFSSGDTDLCTATLPATSCSATVTLGVGSHTVTGSYSGDANNSAQAPTTDLEVTAASVSMTAMPSSVPQEEDTTLSMLGLASDATGTITFTSEGTTLCAADLPENSCLTTITLPLGDHQVSGAYSGDDNNPAQTASTTLTVTPRTCLLHNETIEAGQSWTSGPGPQDGKPYKLTMGYDGNAVIYAGDGMPITQTHTAGNPGARMVWQGDGNLVVYSASGQVLWSAFTGEPPAGCATLAMQSDGNLVIYTPGANPYPVWYTGADRVVGQPPAASGNPLTQAHSLRPGQQIQVGDHLLVMQLDGNLVRYSPTRGTWSSGTAGNPYAWATLQTDGNFVVYTRAGQALWASNAMGGTTVTLTSDGMLVEQKGGSVIWSR